ncbi:hypothetical protein AB0H88_24325 [Nonomuraea sp. NPDC050680]|uniref:hypothetical protein n=1 Tax=Nonomuraea sp. NPDC050680 TaxID=3154630 RepID=UPI0034039B94
MSDAEWETIEPVALWPTDLLTSAMDQVVRRVPGVPQNEAGRSTAGFIEPGFSVVDWSRSAREVHNQVRMYALMGRDHGLHISQLDQPVSLYIWLSASSAMRSASAQVSAIGAHLHS